MLRNLSVSASNPPAADTAPPPTALLAFLKVLPPSPLLSRPAVLPPRAPPHHLLQARRELRHLPRLPPEVRPGDPRGHLRGARGGAWPPPCAAVGPVVPQAKHSVPATATHAFHARFSVCTIKTTSCWQSLPGWSRPPRGSGRQQIWPEFSKMDSRFSLQLWTATFGPKKGISWPWMREES